MMREIDISTLTLEQYFRLIEENLAPGMANDEFRGTIEKDIEDMTIAETSDYPYYVDYAKTDAYYDLPPLLPYFKPIQPYTKHKNESSKEELEEEIRYMSDGELVISEQDTSDNTDAPNLEPHDKGINDTVKEDERPSKELPCQLPPKELSLGIFALPCIIGSFNLYAMAHLGTCVNLMPNSVFIYLKMTDLRKIDMLVGMANMTQQAPLGTLENDQVKIDKFIFPCNFVVIDMPGVLGEMMILGRPFLTTIHAQIDVFNGEISFGIGEDRVKFDVNRNYHRSNVTLEKVYMVTSSHEKESFNPLEMKNDLFSYESPALQGTSKGLTYRLPDNERIALRWHADYAMKFANLYSRIFDKYRRVFNNELEQLSNEYILRIGKKRYVLDDVREKCKQKHGGTTYAWHDEGHEEEELWKSGIEQTEYEPPMEEKWSQFDRMIRDELGVVGSAQGAT
uniref:Reverse transcriptase domain-containing protein n=1 Tax=Tanacetum cinerariifolium TaxID=118510 RepID=A0A6L2JUB3_TANCI|nr:hypothetical protein [Tanacetum cinerariifolium]